jgi:hypothetical protein
MDETDLVLNYIEVCDLHVQRLEAALSHIQDLYPFTVDAFPLKSSEQLAFLDMFTGRLSKLQDTM